MLRKHPLSTSRWKVLPITDHFPPQRVSMYKKKLRQWQINKTSAVIPSSQVQVHASLGRLSPHERLENEKKAPFRWRWVQPVSLEENGNKAAASASSCLQQTALPPKDASDHVDLIPTGSINGDLLAKDGLERGDYSPIDSLARTSSPSSPFSQASSLSVVGSPMTTYLPAGGGSSNSSYGNDNNSVRRTNSPEHRSQSPLRHPQLQHRLETQSLRQLPVPLPLKLAEEMIHAVRTHVARRIEPRLLPPPPPSPSSSSSGSRRRRLPAPECFDTFTDALRIACDQRAKSSSPPRLMISSIERAFEQLEPIILSDHFSVSCVTILSVLTLQTNGLHDIAHALIRRISQIATSIYGPSHSLAIWTRNLKQIFTCSSNNVTNTTQDTVLATMQAATDGIESVLGPNDAYTLTMRSRCDQVLLRLNATNTNTTTNQTTTTTLQTTTTADKILTRFLHTTKPLLDPHFTYPHNLRYYLPLCHDYAHYLFYRTNQPAAAETILADVPNHL